jgi:hypothetical protein
MREAASARLRWRDLVLQTTASFRGPKPPATAEVAGRIKLKHAKHIDAAMQEYREDLGTKILVRMFIKDATSNDESEESIGGDEPVQLELLFPEDERQLASELGEARLYVPTEGRYLPIYDPEQINEDQLDEAAEYLDNHASATAHKARLVRELARHRRLKRQTRRS